ncbi:MAG: hypothetical protein MUO72_04075 [Bacteroidales bacterium]|nr:hypothetical protein [Bacteroidales bacterium]
MRGQKELFELLEKLNVAFEYHEHPPLATIEDAKIHWRDYSSGRCKNIEPGSVSPFGLINDKEKHVHLFMDEKLNESDRLAFHPNDNTASLVIAKSDFLRFLEYTGNTYEFIKLYD